MITTIVFFNHFHFGDLHVSRSFIRDMIQKLPNLTFQYTHKLAFHPLEDINELSFVPNVIETLDKNESLFVRNETHLFINTWYAQQNQRFMKFSCSFYTLKCIFEQVYQHLGIPLEPEIQFYYPSIDFSKLNLTPYLHFIHQNLSTKKYQKMVLVCTGNVWSGQSVNFDFTPFVNIIAAKNPNFLFIITSPIRVIQRPNIIQVQQIHKKSFDLNEIAFLSTHCSFIIGRSSGPYTFSLLKENLMDPKKTFICISNQFILGLAAQPQDVRCRYFHTTYQNQHRVLHFLLKHVR